MTQCYVYPAYRYDEVPSFSVLSFAPHLRGEGRVRKMKSHAPSPEQTEEIFFVP